MREVHNLGFVSPEGQDMVGNLDHEGSRREFLGVLAQFDTPAFIKRARRVEDAEAQILSHCRGHRTALLEIPGIRLATAGALIAYKWESLGDYLREDGFSAYLDALYKEWEPQLRVEVLATDSRRKIRRTLRELVSSFENFNKKWAQFLRELDLTSVNQVREDYNNYYVCEKACAFDSEQIGQRGFERLPPMMPDDVVKKLPYLNVPTMR